MKARLDKQTDLRQYPSKGTKRRVNNKDRKDPYLNVLEFYKNPNNLFWEKKHPGEPRHSEASKEYFRTLHNIAV